MYSWGYGGSGCLGTGTYESHDQPTLVQSLPLEGSAEVQTAEAGGYHNFVVVETEDGGQKVYVWGRGDVGQLGIPSIKLRSD